MTCSPAETRYSAVVPNEDVAGALLGGGQCGFAVDQPRPARVSRAALVALGRQSGARGRQFRWRVLRGDTLSAGARGGNGAGVMAQWYGDEVLAEQIVRRRFSLRAWRLCVRSALGSSQESSLLIPAPPQNPSLAKPPSSPRKTKPSHSVATPSRLHQALALQPKTRSAGLIVIAGAELPRR